MINVLKEYENAKWVNFKPELVRTAFNQMRDILTAIFKLCDTFNVESHKLCTGLTSENRETAQKNRFEKYHQKFVHGTSVPNTLESAYYAYCLSGLVLKETEEYYSANETMYRIISQSYNCLNFCNKKIWKNIIEPRKN